jgi:hypothetical protein
MSNGNQHKSPSTPIMDIQFDGAMSQNGSNPPSMISMSEDAVDDEGICTESWANALVSELCHFKKERTTKSSVTDDSNRMELMDDFLEMERLACLSSETNGSDNTIDKMNINDVGVTLSGTAERDGVKASPMSEKSPLLKLKSRISSFLDSESQENSVGKMLDSIKNILKDIEDEADSMSANGTHHPDTDEVSDTESLGKPNGGLNSVSKCATDQELMNSVLKIQDFVKLLDQELSRFQGQ